MDGRPLQRYRLAKMKVEKLEKAVTVISDDRNKAVLEMTAKFVKVIIKPIYM